MAKRGDAEERRVYQLLEEMDRLQDLLEELDELGLSSREEIERRMAELDEQIDQANAE